MDNKEYLTIMDKVENIVIQNKQLKKANTKMQKENKHLRRVIAKLKKDQNKDRQHYKNGKRGTNYNG